MERERIVVDALDENGVLRCIGTIPGFDRQPEPLMRKEGKVNGVQCELKWIRNYGQPKVCRIKVSLDDIQKLNVRIQPESK